MKSVTKTFTLTISAENVNDETFNAKHIGSFSITLNIQHENASFSDFDTILSALTAMAGLGAKAASNTITPQVKNESIDKRAERAAAIADPFRGMAHGLCPHKQGETETQREIRILAELDRQSGYNDAASGKPNDSDRYTWPNIYNAGYSKYTSAFPAGAT